MAISAGVTFFAIKKPIKTIMVLLLMGFGPAYVAFDYFGSYRATIEDAVPLKAVTPTGFRLTQERPEEIVIQGQVYGYARPGFKAWVLQEVDAILVYDIARGEIRKVDIRGLTKK